MTLVSLLPSAPAQQAHRQQYGAIQRQIFDDIDADTGFSCDIRGVQPQFAIALIGMAIANVDAPAINFDRADENSAGANFVGVEVRIGLYTIERFERHTLGMTRPHQEIAEVTGVVRVRQIGAGRRANVPDKRAQAGKRARDGVRLEEENGVLGSTRRGRPYVSLHSLRGQQQSH